MNLRQKISHGLLDLAGWHTKRHIVVFESDDWGAIRMPSLEVYKFLKSQGISVGDSYGYDFNDTLASNDDLEFLMDVLSSVKDSKGNPAKITLNCCVANPDFKRIKENGFKEYFYEPFTETLKRYPNHDRSFQLWKEGIKHKVFQPQFHGREHLNAQHWLQLLQQNEPSVRKAFDHEVYSMGVNLTGDPRKHVMAAYDALHACDYGFLCDSVREGLDLFESLFGFRSLTMIAPCYTWDEQIEDSAHNCGVQVFQGGRVQISSECAKFQGKKSKRHCTGQKNNREQIYLVRSCSFEPTQNSKYNADNCMNEISFDFQFKKPAIVSCHRLNFIGGLSKANRDKNLWEFERLLQMIVAKYPDVEFMASDELGTLIINQYYEH